MGDFLLVQMPLSGRPTSPAVPSASCPTPTASVLTPSDPVRMRWSADNDQLIVRVELGALERVCAAYLGRRPEQALRFALGMARRRRPAGTS